MDNIRSSSFSRKSSRRNWLKRAPRKDPLKLKEISKCQVMNSLHHAVHHRGPDICKDFQTMCEMVKTTLPLDLRTTVVQDLTASQVIENEWLLIRVLLLHLLADVQHIILIVNVLTDSPLILSEEECNQILAELEPLCGLSLLSLHIEGVLFMEGVLSAIMFRSAKLASIHVSGDDAASEVLSCISKDPKRLHYLHLDKCSVNDLDVIHALVRCYNDTVSWTDMDIAEVGEASTDHDYPPLCHLSVQSPLISVCGAVILLHSLRNLQTLQYSHWNSSICNLLQYLQVKVPNSQPFALTSISLWRVTEKSLSTLKLCPNLQYLMMECTDPTLTSMQSLAKLKKLNSLKLRLLPEELLVSAVKAVGKKLLSLEVEYEEYAKTPIKWDTIHCLQKLCPSLKRLEMHHINIIANSSHFLTPLFKASFVDLAHFNLSSVVIQPALLNRLLYKNTALETMILDVNKEALTDSGMITLAKTNNFSQLREIHLGSGLLTTRSLIYYMTLPSLNKISIQISNFPQIKTKNFETLQLQIANGNYKCTVEDVKTDD